MNILFKNSVFYFCYYLGIFKLFYFFTSNRQKIITFHHVIPERYFDKSLCLGVSCTDDVFDYQIKLISEKLKFTTDVGKKNSCMITFDDGYKNNHSIALPILDKYSIKAIFFITFNLILNGKTLWIDLILKWCSYVPEGTYKIDDIEIKITDKTRSSVYEYIINKIKKDYSSKDTMISLLDNIYAFKKLRINPVLDALRFKALSLSQLEQMKKEGHLVASHTINHDILSLLEKDMLNNEIENSVALHTKFCNCNYFAYPFGGTSEVSNDVLSAYDNSMYDFCFVNYWNFNTNYNTNKVERFSLPNTKKKYIIHAYLSGFYSFFKKKIKHV